MPSTDKLIFLLLFICFSIVASIKHKNIYLLYYLFIFIVALDKGYGFFLHYFIIRLIDLIAIAIIMLDYRAITQSITQLRNYKLTVPILYCIYVLLNILLSQGNNMIQHIFNTLSWFLVFVIFMTFFFSSPRKNLKNGYILLVIGFSINLYNFLPNIFTNLDFPLIIKSNIPHHFYASRYGTWLSAIVSVSIISNKGFKRIVLINILLLILLLTIMSGARLQSLAAIVVSLLAFKLKLRSFLLFLIYSIALWVLLFPLIPKIESFQRYSRLTNYYETRESYTNDPSEIAFRKDNIQIAWEGFSDSPVFGQGVGEWKSWGEYYTGGDIYLTVHNSYMHFLVEQGALGLFLIFLMLYRGLLKYRDISNYNPHYPVLYTSSLFLYALLIIGLGHSIIAITFYLPMFIGIRYGFMARLLYSKDNINYLSSRKKGVFLSPILPILP